MSDCIEWQGGKSRGGYGVKWDASARKTRYVHRVAYEEAHGITLGPRDFICHRCDNPACYNIDHLFLGDNSANVADMVSKGRQARGFRKPNTRLTDDDVKAIRIRRANGDRVRDIAADYRIHSSHVSKIAAGTRRPDLEG